MKIMANPVKMIEEGSPRLIHNEEELEAYTDALFRLTALEKPTRSEMEAIELLTVLVERYEREHYPILSANPESIALILENASSSPGLICTLSEGVLPQRRAEIRALLGSRTALTLHEDGVEMRFVFSEESARGLLDFVFFERLCCKTFSYELGFPPPHTAIHLRLRAPAEQVEALQAFYR
jgi:antitoxin component HigA of HigAB toxin-antitoxin module